MKIVKLADVAPQPWRNGGGTTRDLAAWPSAAHWAWRISVAEVARDGPFSGYPGIARWFAVVQGAGVVLHFGDDDRRMGPESLPLHFDGGRAPDCTLIDGPTLDLNLLVRQDAGHGEMLPARPATEWHSTAPLRAVFTAHAAELRVDGRPVAALAAGSLALGDDAAAERWRLVPEESVMQAWWLSFKPHNT
jgi:environmental stress-induced protein Ves